MRKHPNIIGYSLLMASFAFGNGVIGVSLPGSHEVQVTYAAFATVVLSVLAFRWLPRQLAMCNFYMFISNVLYINIGGAQVTEGLATSSDCCARACMQFTPRFGCSSFPLPVIASRENHSDAP
jgi:hypothetical protein